jgi:cysteine-rich repeat protein
VTKIPSTHSLRAAVLLLALAAATCFTGDGLVGQPCDDDPDCNPLADVVGEALVCRHNVCGYTPRCGDAIVDADLETCDDGAANLAADYADGPGRCSASECTLLPYCGDGNTDAPHEQCDDANAINTDACPATCRAAACGDGFVGPGEACDFAEDPDCTDLCARPTCGDGVLQGLEQCDDGNPDDADDCLNTCLLARCGDGVVHPQRGEQCDDGNDNDGDACVDACAAAACGDGYLQVGVEQCDDGNKDFLDACVGACAPAACGDGYLQVGVEQCDDGNLVAEDDCSPTCKHENCGDGIKQQTEACDDGNLLDGDGCTSTCTFENCGDKVVQPPEACDDGNLVNTDDCVNCELAACGDAVTQDGVEECDDGNPDDGDSCTGACLVAACGDGFVQQGVEACDDGNPDDGDACLNDCALNVCGDDFVHQGVEACDDGNNTDLDACLNNCALNVCGDGILDTIEEECDDANIDDNDGCANDCRKGATALWAGATARHTCARRGDQIRCWGINEQGQLGVGSTANVGDEKVDLPPVDVDPGGVALKVVTSRQHSCALLVDKSVRCWGLGDLLGRGNGKSDKIGDAPGEMPPKDPVVLGGPVADIVAGESHTCALLEGPAGAVVCWGTGTGTGYKNKGNVGLFETPASVGPVPLGGEVQQIAAGAGHTCALFKGPFAGKVRCWGSNDFGQLGLGHTDYIGDNEDPKDAPFLALDGPGDPVVRIHAGSIHSCALLSSGKLFCWGSNGQGQLGNWAGGSNVGDNEAPNPAGEVRVLEVGDQVLGMAMGNSHTCARLAAGKVRCWGNGSDGALGSGNTSQLGGSPGQKAPFVDVGGPALDLVGGLQHVCALLNGGRVRCWGNNQFGQLGIGSTQNIGDNPGEMPPQDVFLYTKPK